MENLGVSESRALSKPSNSGASPTPPVTPISRNSYSRKRKLVSRDPATAASSKTTFCIDTDNSSSSNGSHFSCADLDLEPPPKTGSRSRLIFGGASLKDSTGTIEFLPHSSEIRRNAQPKGPNIEDRFKERNNLNTLREGGDTCFQHNAIESYSNTYRRHHSFINGRNASQAGYQSSCFYSYPHWTRFPNFQAFGSTIVLQPHCLPSTSTSICSPANVIQQYGGLHSTSAASVSCPAIALQPYNLSTTPASVSCPANALQPYDLPSTSASVSSPLGVHTPLAPYTPEKRVHKPVGNNSLSLASINSNSILATSELVETLFGINSNPISNLEDHGLSAAVESQKRSVSTNDKAEAQEQTLMGASCVDVIGGQTECISLAATQRIPQLERTLTKGKKIMDVSASAELEHKNKDASYIRLNTDETRCFSLVSSQITAESEFTLTKGQDVFGEVQIVTGVIQEEVILGDVQAEAILNLNRASKQKERRRKHRPKVKVECSSKNNSQAKKSRNKSGAKIAVKRRKQETAANDSIGTDISSKLQKDMPTDQINDQCRTYGNLCQLNSSAKALEPERPMPSTENTENLNLLQTTAQIQKMNLPDNLEDELQGMSPSVQNKDTLGDPTIAVSMPEQQAGSVKRKRTSRKNAKQLARKGPFSALHSKEKQKESLEITMSVDQGQNKNPQIRNMPATRLLALEESFVNVEEDELTEMMKKLKLDEDNPGWDIVLPENNRELVACIVNKDIVTYEGPFQPLKKRKPRARVTLDNETNRIWRLLMGKASTDDSNPTDKEEKEKQWEEERNIFKGRVDSFIARMHLVQGDRRFSKWKGSIVDSVIGAFLTQNVADHLSSSAFMALASRFPPIPPIEKGELTAEDDKDFSKAELDLNKISNEATDTSQNLEGLTDASTSSESYASNYVSDKGTFSPLTTSNCSSIASKGPHTESEICTPREQTLCSDCSNNVSEQLNMNSMENSSSGGLNFFGDLLKQVERKAGENSENVLRSEASEPSCDTEVSVDLGLYSESMLDMLNEQKTQLQESMSTFMYENSGTGHAVNSIIAGAECSPDTEESVNAIAGICSPDKKEKSSSAEANVNTAEIIRCLEKSDCQESRHVVSEAPRQNIKYTKYCARNLHLHDMHPPEEYAIESTISSQASMQPGAINMLNNDNLKEQIQSSTLQSNKVPKRNTSGIDRANIEMKQGASKKTSDWEKIKKKIFRYQYSYCRTKKERDQNSKDAVNWDAVRCADVEEIAETIRDRGMNNVLAGRIKVFLERVHSEQDCIDLEWLKDVPPDDAKDFLLGVRGLGLKSVECIRLLALQHLAFPVDTNVGRICVRLGWVPIQPLPESLQLHLLELYPILESIQKYLWPRLCTLDQRTLYELHYQMITFGKVFCTKSKPNCNACPMRCDCKHFASAFASARLALPAPSEESALVHSESNFLTLPTVQSIYQTIDTDICNNNFPKHLLEAKPEEFKDQKITADTFNNSSSDHLIEASPEVSKCEPIIEEPMTPEPENVECSESAAEEHMDPDEIPVINLNYEQLQLNVQKIYEGTVQDGDTTSGTVSKALVIMSPAAASIPEPKLKNVGRLRTEHRVYELPDDHPLLNEFEPREADDPTHYLLAIWSPGETADSIGATEQFSNLKECEKHHCEKESCNSCLASQDSNENTVKGTMLIPVKTAMRGSFPLNGTYFQVNEVFADHETSLRPMKVPRSWIWNLERRTVYFGTSIPTIFRGLPTGEIQKCFWRGFVCVRGFDRQVRAPRPLVARLHFPASKQVRPQKRETAHRKPKPKLTEKTQTQTSDTNRNEISSIK